MCLDYLNGVARKSIMEGEIKSSQSWPQQMVPRVLAAVEGSALLLPTAFGVTRRVWRLLSLPARAPRAPVNSNPLDEVRNESLVV